jgi:hypothetical protein
MLAAEAKMETNAEKFKEGADPDQDADTRRTEFYAGLSGAINMETMQSHINRQNEKRREKVEAFKKKQADHDARNSQGKEKINNRNIDNVH